MPPDVVQSVQLQRITLQVGRNDGVGAALMVQADAAAAHSSELITHPQGSQRSVSSVSHIQ